MFRRRKFYEMSSKTLERKLDSYISKAEKAISQKDDPRLNNLLLRMLRRGEGAPYESEVSDLCDCMAEESPDISQIKKRVELILALHAEDYTKAAEIKRQLR